MGAYDCDCINNLEYDRRERKQKEQSRSTARSTAQSTDLIDRQAAIDAYGDWYVEEGTEEGFIGTVKQLLEGLPSAQPEPQEGHWIRRDCGLDVECKCSRCGYKDFVEPRDEYWFKRNYCPNCGADMRGEQDG